MTPETTPFLLRISSLDWIGIGFLLVFSLLGIFRGGPWQLRRFLGVLLAMLVARLVSPIAAPVLRSLIDPTQPKLAVGVAYLLLFLLTLCMLALLFKLLTPAKRAKKKREKDEVSSKEPVRHRTLGWAFGVLTAFALYATLITCVLLLDPQASSRSSYAASRGARWTSAAIESMGAVFPLEARHSVAKPAVPVEGGIPKKEAEKR